MEKMKQRAERFNSSDASLSETKVEKSVFKKICELFDLIERATKGKWSRTPNQIDRDLDFIFQSFNVERFHDSRFSFAYNLDVNCRQLDIYFSGIDNVDAKHAVLCKKRYCNIQDIPNSHLEDISCCKPICKSYFKK